MWYRMNPSYDVVVKRNLDKLLANVFIKHVDHVPWLLWNPNCEVS
jgi:hypothetical protein